MPDSLSKGPWFNSGECHFANEKGGSRGGNVTCAKFFSREGAGGPTLGEASAAIASPSMAVATYTYSAYVPPGQTAPPIRVYSMLGRSERQICAPYIHRICSAGKSGGSLRPPLNPRPASLRPLVINRLCTWFKQETVRCRDAAALFGPRIKSTRRFFAHSIRKPIIYIG